MLSRRLQKVIYKVIGVEQSAFLKGRFILDGVLVANEMIDDLKKKKKKCMIFKVDFEKAFDSINWEFLFKVMERVGFDLKWRRWIRACLSSASVSVLVNGSPTDEFRLHRGIKQGDPLSPYLFIIVAEGLNPLIKQALRANLLKGIEVGKDKIIVSHLQYADDTILFREWSKRNVRNVLNVLNCFEIFSELKVTVAKSCLYGFGVQNNIVEEVAKIHGCQNGCLPFFYLGLPMDFTNLFEKIVCKGDKTLFWSDRWLNNEVFRDKFGRLFRLEEVKDALVMDRIVNDGLNSTCSWNWVRNPSGKTATELLELENMIQNFKFVDGSCDGWSWKLQANGLFSTNSLFKIIDGKMLHENGSHINTERLPILPQKIGVFVSRVKQRRIPVRIELDKRGVDLDSVRCPVCDNDLETVDHVFLHCSFAKNLWSRVFRWWNINRPMYSRLDEIFHGIYDVSHPSHPSLIWKATEWVYSYVIWQNRNSTLFRKKKGNGPMALNEIQINAFEWISRR
ncbi:uncharacterized protein [Rutidosis leptorrhynchoides]|uniref:uncharacterized protein n=1 Tax=Rutidosis leptorrhynchoides TaxID=125765 RepID=UPI003A9980B8